MFESLLPFLFATAPAIRVPPLALAALSAAVLLLLLDHRRTLLGNRAALVFLAATCFYGLVRSLSIRTLSDAQLGGAPYRLTSPLLTFWGVPLQELLGWTVAVGLAAFFADRLLRRLGQSTDAYRTTLVAGLGMAAVCFAVETAAVAGGWWTWSLAHRPTYLLNFPAIALVDWGFVAIDFLLPFELWRRRAPLGPRLFSLLLFPIHLAGHAFTSRLPGPFPISGFDLVHVGLIAGVLAAAATTREQSPWPPLAENRLRFQPLVAAAILLGTTTTQLLLQHEGARLFTALPLLLLAIVAVLARKEPMPTGQPLGHRRAVLLFAGLLVVGLALLLPAAHRSREFEQLLQKSAMQLIAQKPQEAKTTLATALAIRPEHSEALWLLGWAEMQAGNRQEARRHLEASLAQRPDSKEAAQLLAILNQNTPPSP